jgi:hypothetical protein
MNRQQDYAALTTAIAAYTAGLAYYNRDAAYQEAIEAAQLPDTRATALHAAIKTYEYARTHPDPISAAKHATARALALAAYDATPDDTP